MRIDPRTRRCSSRPTRAPIRTLILLRTLVLLLLMVGLVLLRAVPAAAGQPNQLMAGQSLSWPTTCPSTLHCLGGSYAVISLDGSTKLSIVREVSGAVPSGGTLELHSPSASWSSSMQGAVVATMQTDGNFVAFDAGGNSIWSTKTSGHPGAFLQVDTSRFEIIESSGATIFQSAPPPAPPAPPICTAARDCSEEYIDCNQVPNPLIQSVTGTTAVPSQVGIQNAYAVPPGNYQVCNVNPYDNTKACQAISEPPASSSCIACSPACSASDLCEVISNQGVCVPNHRCIAGYHFCGGNCVPGTGQCP